MMKMIFGGFSIGEEEERKKIEEAISDSGHEMNALGHAGEEGRIRPRKSTVSCQIGV